MNEAEARKLEHLELNSKSPPSPDAVILSSDDDEPQFVGEIKAKGPSDSEKVSETEKDEVKVLLKYLL